MPPIGGLWPYHDLDILIERDEERQEPFCGECRQATTNQRRDFGLIDPHDTRRFILAPPLRRYDTSDPHRQDGLGEIFLRFGKV